MITAKVIPLWDSSHWCSEMDRRVGWDRYDCPLCNEIVRVDGEYACPGCGEPAFRHPLIPGISGGFRKLCDGRIVKT